MLLKYPSIAKYRIQQFLETSFFFLMLRILLSATDPKGYPEDVGRNVDNFTCSLCLEAVRRAICSDLQYAKSIYFGIEAAFFICVRIFWHV